MVKADYVKEGAVVIDVGINAKPEGGGICGDVDTDDVVEKSIYGNSSSSRCWFCYYFNSC